MANRMSQVLAKQQVDRMHRVANGLRDLADEVERHAARGERRYESGNGMSWVLLASDVVHKVTWGVANLNLDGIVANARDADEAIRNDPEDPRS